MARLRVVRRDGKYLLLDERFSGAPISEHHAAVAAIEEKERLERDAAEKHARSAA